MKEKIYCTCTAKIEDREHNVVCTDSEYGRISTITKKGSNKVEATPMCSTIQECINGLQTQVRDNAVTLIRYCNLII